MIFRNGLVSQRRAWNETEPDIKHLESLPVDTRVKTASGD